MKITKVYVELAQTIADDKLSVIDAWELAIVLAQTVARSDSASHAELKLLGSKATIAAWLALLDRLGVYGLPVQVSDNIPSKAAPDAYLITGNPDTLIKFINRGGQGMLFPTDGNNTPQGARAMDLAAK